MEIENNKTYTMYQLVKENAFKGVSPNIMSYVQFIGRQTLRGNHLISENKKSDRTGYKIKGEDLKKFIENIK